MEGSVAIGGDLEGNLVIVLPEDIHIAFTGSFVQGRIHGNRKRTVICGLCLALA